MDDKKKQWLLIAGTTALAIIFLMFGAGKFIDPAKWIGKFDAWGIPEWFVSVSGALEIAGAIGLFIPVVRGLAGIGLSLFMIGAVATHVVHAEIGMIFVAGAIMVGSFVVGKTHLPETMAFLKRGSGSE